MSGMSELDRLMASEPRNPWHTPARVVACLLGLGALFMLVPLKEVAVADGEVVPQGRVKVIQHLEGGIIEEIHVRDGDRVRPDDPLVQLDLGGVGINREEVQVEMDGLKLMRARLEAEAKAASLEFPAEEAARRPDLVEQETRTNRARVTELESLLAMLREQVRQREHDVDEMRARKRATGKELRLTREKLEMADELIKDGLISKMEHAELKRDVARLEGDHSALSSGLPRAESALEEAREHEREQDLKFRRSAEEELAKVELEIARLQERLTEADDQQMRTTIRSPIAGIVKNLKHHTIGGVVKPGESIMEVVPSDETLIVEAKLHPVDRGYVVEGQPARVKISSFDFVRFGALDGTVQHVAADASNDEKRNPFFRVLIETEKSYLGEDDNPHWITPGMQAVVDIETGTKLFFQYLVRPVLKLPQEAFRER